MNQQAFESGKRAYQGADWLTAVSYLGQAKRPGEISGEVDHLLGNAYMNLGRYDQAASAYASALADTSYGKRGALSCNRGRALLAAGRPQEAVTSLNEALQDASYATPYKAQMALGSAYESLGDVRSAGIAYRAAAIDEANPAPAVALCKLGDCFMGLGRAVDAVEAYRTALDFTTPLESQGHIWSDLGCAYASLNRMSEAVDAFSHATSDGYQLSPEAQATYDASRKALASIAGRRPSETDEFLAAAGYGPGSSSGSFDPLDPLGESGELMPSPEDTGFFTVSEEDLVREAKGAKRRKKHRHPFLKFLVFLLVLVAIAACLAFGAYYLGYGYPTQQAVVEGLFESAGTDEGITAYLSDQLSDDQVSQIESALPEGADVEVLGCDQSATSSTVYLTASLAEGGEQDYVVELARSGISWVVTSVSPAYLSDSSVDEDATATDGSTDDTSTDEASTDDAGSDDATDDAGTDDETSSDADAETSSDTSDATTDETTSE